MASASEQVSETVELLEMILLKLPTRDIWIAERVSKLWKGLINTSSKLQEALFVKALDACVDPQKLHRDAVCGKLYATPAGHFVKKYTFFKNPLIEPFLDALYRRSNSKSFLSLLPPDWTNQYSSWRRTKLMHPSTEITALYYRVLQGSRSGPIATKSINTGNMNLGEFADWLEWTCASTGSRMKTASLVLNGSSIELDFLHPLEDYSEVAKLKRELAHINEHKGN